MLHRSAYMANIILSHSSPFPPSLHIHRRTGQHPFGGSNRILPEYRTRIVFTRPRQGEKDYNELLQCIFLYVRRLVPDESLLLILVPFGDTVSPTNTVFDVITELFAYVIMGKKTPQLPNPPGP